MKLAPVTGVTGQDRSYLSELQLQKGYEGHGVEGRASLFGTQCFDDIFEGPRDAAVRFRLHRRDLIGISRPKRLISEFESHEIEHSGGQSHAAENLESRSDTPCVQVAGALRRQGPIRFPSLEQGTPFRPHSPRAVARTHAPRITVQRREAHGMHISSAMLTARGMELSVSTETR